jgi:hypothetical protein
MSAAILQGCPATTLDTDLWIDLPARQYMRVLRLCQKLGATVRANTVVDLSEDEIRPPAWFSLLTSVHARVPGHVSSVTLH